MPAHPDSIALGVAIATAADDVKAIDPALYDVADILGVVEAFVVVSTTSDRQLDAVVDRIEAALRDEHDERPLRREGTPASGWVLLDYGPVVAHVFLREQRAFYDLDRLFSDAAHHDPITGELVSAMVAGADDRAVHQDVVLGVPSVPVVPTPSSGGAAPGASVGAGHGAGAGGAGGDVAGGGAGVDVAGDADLDAQGHDPHGDEA